jgi:hypothetical protein
MEWKKIVVVVEVEEEDVSSSVIYLSEKLVQRLAYDEGL